MDLSGLRCIVTGASSGIGKSTCQILTGYGATVVGSGRDEVALSTLKDEGIILDYVVADITQDGECARFVQDAATLLGGTITTVINAAGGLQGGAVGEIGLDNYQYNMKLNTQAPFEIMTNAIPYLKAAAAASPSGSENGTTTTNPSIVSVSSVNGKQSFAGCATYCMSKAALDQLTRCASVDLAKFGIRVNCVNPGVVKTNLHRVSMHILYFKSFPVWLLGIW
jgi:NAD(P)-dependent dehydrogenase (short-subunit alcohol dehydrogenase family)